MCYSLNVTGFNKSFTEQSTYKRTTMKLIDLKYIFMSNLICAFFLYTVYTVT